MGALAKRVYVISDLHMGGHQGCRLFYQGDALAAFVRELAAEAANAEHDVELVINGDFVDFLAVPVGTEVDGEWTWPENAPPGGWTFSAFRRDPAEAEAVFRLIAQEEKDVFAALRELLACGGALTLLLGNHDLELSFPNVRRALEEVLDAEGKRYRFLYDGEAYVVGDVLIEHGNQLDAVNRTDYDALRKFRSHLSRRRLIPAALFVPPLGSRLVERVFAPIATARGCGFVLRLKPELSKAHRMLLAFLNPRIMRDRVAIIREALRAGTDDVLSRVKNSVASKKLAADREGEKRGSADFLEELLMDVDPEDRERFFGHIGVASKMQLSAGVDPWAKLLDDSAKSRRRLESLSIAIQQLREDRSFDPAVEPDRGIRSFLDVQTKQSVRIRGNKFRVVVLGHTHFVRTVRDNDGRLVYYNTGTWADVQRFPACLVDGPSNGGAVQALAEFVHTLRRGGSVDRNQPNLRLDFDANRVLVAHKLVGQGAGNGGSHDL